MFAKLIRLIRFTLLLTLLVLVVVFAVSNRGDVALSLYPLPFEINLPLYVFFLATLVVGYLWGALSNSVSTFHHKRETKKGLAKVDALEQEVSSLRARQTVTSAPSEPDTPKLN